MIERPYLDQRIRKVPDWPLAGILFYDITTLFEDASAFRRLIDELAGLHQGQKIDKIVGIDARGFLLASALAYQLNAGISLVRKKGKLPFKTMSSSYQKEYGPDTIEMHHETIKPGEQVLIVDDLLATGGTMLATIDLVNQAQGNIVSIDVVINLSFLPGLKKLRDSGLKVNYLIEYQDEKVIL